MRTLIATAIIASVVLGDVLSAQNMMTGTISMIRTGWNDDSFAIVTAEPMPNPAGCARADGYITHKSLPGYQTYYAAALTAFATRRRVVLTVHNSECYGGWPKLIGVNLIQE